MEKHIALLFLSIFQTNKAFIINDKTGKNIDIPKLKGQNDYYGKDGFAVKGRHTNEPAVYYLLDKYKELDKLFIFASDKVRSQFNYLDDQDILHNSKNYSQLQLFMDSVVANYEITSGQKLSKDIFEVVDYDEPVITDKEDYKNWSYDSNNTDFASILEMASKVKAYCDNVKQAEGEAVEIHLHVDMTGGFRHANMLMLAVVDLLKYSGLKVDDVIYTNFDQPKRVGKIEEVTNIHNVFQLVAGAEEFVRYGSVDSLQGYFATLKTSEELKVLLQSMKNFADVLKLCRAGMIKDAIDNLRESIISYQEKVVNGLDNVISEEEKVFDELLATIEEKYAPVFVDNNELNIISWCMDNGFTQQALTFFTELVPQLLYREKILYTNDKKIIEKCQHDKQDYVPWEKYLVLNYTIPKITALFDEAKTNEILSEKEVIVLFRKIFMSSDKETEKEFEANFLKAVDKKTVYAYQQMRDEIDKNNILKMMLKNNNGLDKLKRDYPYLYKVAYYTYSRGRSNPNMAQFVELWKKKIDTESMYGSFGNMPEKIIRELLALSDGMSNSEAEGEYVKVNNKKLFTKSKARREQAKLLVEYKVLKSDFSAEAAADRVYDYYKVCELRNMVNHANAEEKIENADIIREINKAIENLNSMLKK